MLKKPLTEVIEYVNGLILKNIKQDKEFTFPFGDLVQVEKDNKTDELKAFLL